MISKYSCIILGEDYRLSKSLSVSGVRRLKAYALAIHVPVLFWLISASMIAWKIFGLDLPLAMSSGVVVAGFIYLLERLVLVTSGGWYIGLARFIIAVLISIIGASLIDLILFEKEIIAHHSDSKKMAAAEVHEKKMHELKMDLDKKEGKLDDAQKDAKCEADGSCGTLPRGVGPVYREKVKLVDKREIEYSLAKAKLEEQEKKYDFELNKIAAEYHDISDLGILSRVQSLHQYVWSNLYALIALIVLFSFMFFLEMMVLFVKYAFNQDTVDDKLLRIKDEIKMVHAKHYQNAVTSPHWSVERLLESKV